jgi:hypothetical protein
MPPKILRRCSICKNWGAVFLTPDARLGTLYLCYSCWKAREHANPEAPAAHAEDSEKKDAPSNEPNPSDRTEL